MNLRAYPHTHHIQHVYPCILRMIYSLCIYHVAPRPNSPSACARLSLRIRIPSYIIRTYVPRANATIMAHGMANSSSLHRQRPRLSMYARERIRQLLSEGSTCVEVVTALRQEGIDTCRQTVWRLERHITVHGTVQPLPG